MPTPWSELVYVTYALGNLAETRILSLTATPGWRVLWSGLINDLVLWSSGHVKKCRKGQEPMTHRGREVDADQLVYYISDGMWRVSAFDLTRLRKFRRVPDPKILHYLFTILPTLTFSTIFLGQVRGPEQAAGTSNTSRTIPKANQWAATQAGRTEEGRLCLFHHSPRFLLSQLITWDWGSEFRTRVRPEASKMGFSFFTSRAAARFLDGIGRPGVSTAALLLTAARCGCLLRRFPLEICLIFCSFFKFCRMIYCSFFCCPLLLV
jgi:hypothetical protein